MRTPNEDSRSDDATDVGEVGKGFDPIGEDDLDTGYGEDFDEEDSDDEPDDSYDDEDSDSDSEDSDSDSDDDSASDSDGPSSDGDVETDEDVFATDMTEAEAEDYLEDLLEPTYGAEADEMVEDLQEATGMSATELVEDLADYESEYDDSDSSSLTADLDGDSGMVDQSDEPDFLDIADG